MGILAPLYLAGLAALSLPLIFHLVRRTPRGRLPFSSLMFLSPSPPRLTRRSRLDQILLLLLRAAALALLAFAFARPFLREAATLALDGVASRRVAIVIDTSASMRRGDLWQQAVRRARQEIDELTPRDDVALFAFDDRLRTLVEFERPDGSPTPAKAQVVRQRLETLRPGWGGTDLGNALVTLAGELDVSGDVAQTAGDPLIVVISDMQQGSRTDTLQNFEWPQHVRVALHALLPARPTNAFAHVMTSDDEAQPDEVRVRVASAANSTGDQFFVGWAGGRGDERSDEIAVYVPPGQSRVVRLPRPAGNLLAEQLILRGDDHAFDNVHYAVPPQPQEVRLAWLGEGAADDPQGMQFYLRAALDDDPLRKVTVVRSLRERSSGSQGETSIDPHLVIATGPLAADDVTALQQYVERGGTLLLVPRDRQAAASVVHFFDDLELRDDPPLADGKYLLLGEIDFQHPLFAPFANPRYSDFTKVHFWRHTPVSLQEGGATRAIARFDNGDPALLEVVGTPRVPLSGDGARSVPATYGRVLLLTAGWDADDSQLALSSKFVPLVQALLDYACGPVESGASLTVGQPLPLPERRSATTIVHTPDGQQLSAAAGAATFDQTDQPGIYRLQSGEAESRFAVNIAAAESNTAPLDLEQLEQWGVRLGASLTRAERIDRVRQQRDTELEGRQKLWRWLIVSAMGILMVETWWAGRAARQAHSAEDATATV